MDNCNQLNFDDIVEQNEMNDMHILNSQLSIMDSSTKILLKNYIDLILQNKELENQNRRLKEGEEKW